MTPPGPLLRAAVFAILTRREANVCLVRLLFSFQYLEYVFA
jgi:hypothetical protein